MPIQDRMKLNKLTITAYSDKERNIPLQPNGTFEALFNPASLSQKYEIEYAKQQAVGSSDGERRYIRNKPQELKLKLILDETGVSTTGVALLATQSTVAEKVKHFLRLAFHYNGDIHQPNFLIVKWGTLSFWGSPEFRCRLESVEIDYTSFNRDGTPLRAELDVKLISDQALERRLAQENAQSPDLTHRRVIKSGDTLPLLCREIYGEAAYYLRVAQANNLDSFRTLTPGQELIFPPLER